MALFAEFMGKGFQMPGFTPLDMQKEQAKAISGNLSALPQIEDLAARYNQFSRDQTNVALDAVDPFRQQIAEQASKNRLDWSKGVMSKDLADQVQMLTAQRSVGGGYGGTGMQDAALARNYGLTSFDLQQKAQSSEESWLRTAAAIYQPGMFNVSSMMVTPQQQTEFAIEERNAKFQYDYVKNQWDWYNSPAQRVVRFENTVVGLAGDIAGAAGAMCWVARECFGESNPKWILFRHWMLTKAPSQFRNWYLQNGERFAKWIHNKPVLKSKIRSWMETRIATLEVSHAPV